MRGQTRRSPVLVQRAVEDPLVGHAQWETI